MATSAAPHWLVERMIRHLYATGGNLNPEYFAGELGIDQQETIDLAGEVIEHTGYHPVFYWQGGLH